MSLAVRVLVGLAAGLLVGVVLARAHAPGTDYIVGAAAATGAVFVNLIRMTALPLVVSMLIASIGGIGASGALARVGGRGLALMIAMVAAAAAVTIAVARPVFASVSLDESAALALRGSAPAPTSTGTQAGLPSLTQWVVDLVPPNPFKAAADGSMLPVIVFSILFAVALARADEAHRGAVLRVINGVADAMQRLVSGILWLAPFGVFALAVPLAARLGLSAAGAVVVYIGLVVTLTVVVALLLVYPVGILMGPLSARGFALFCAPAQAVAFASRSSLAALPAMLESAESARLPPIAAGFVLPLAASMFRVGAAVAQPVGVLFLARLYGTPMSGPQLASLLVAVVAATFTVPGIPGGSIIAMVPVLAAVNVPVEGIGILLAVDTIPDMFRTTANATGSLALAAALSASSEPRRD